MYAAATRITAVSIFDLLKRILRSSCTKMVYTTCPKPPRASSASVVIMGISALMGGVLSRALARPYAVELQNLVAPAKALPPIPTITGDCYDLEN
jgi:hypothetical protein